MRIVSLVPSLSELLHALGRAQDVVGVTDYCITPADGFPNAVAVRGTKNPRTGQVIDLAPDLVLANREENRERDLDALREAGLQVHVTGPATVLEVAAMVREVGALVERQQAASALADEIERTHAEVLAARPAPLPAFCPIWRGPWMAVGERTYAGDLLATCGFAPEPRSDERYPRVRLDEVRGVAVVLLPSEPYAFGEQHLAEFADWDADVALVDGELLTWSGPRTPLALRTFAALRTSLDGQ